MASKALLLSALNHVALPPKLPAKEDNEGPVRQELARRLLRASDFLHDYAQRSQLGNWGDVMRGLDTSQFLNEETHLDRDLLLARLKSISSNDFLILHIASQNAGLLIYHELPDDGEPRITFEIFEASPRSADVLAAQSALCWDFPGPVVSIQHTRFHAESFLQALAAWLEQASEESIPQFAAIAKKAQVETPEIRDTVNPTLIAQFLVSFLGSLGNYVEHTPFRKRVRDEVCWGDKSGLPWRRSPLWLVLRVGVQSRLQKFYGRAAGRLLYKLIVTTVVAQLLQDSIKVLDPALIAHLRAKLAGRLAKNELFSQSIPPDSANVDQVCAMMRTLNKVFENALMRATEHIDAEWNTFKIHTLRPVPRLSSRIDESDTILTLPQSGGQLASVLAWSPFQKETLRSHKFTSVPQGYSPYCTQVGLEGYDMYKHIALAYTEEILDMKYRKWSNPLTVREISQDIDNYITEVADQYDSDPRQKSNMILHLMQMWYRLDQLSVKKYPLLENFHPCFNPELFDVLQLTSLGDLQALLDIQNYLRSRAVRCGTIKSTIFDEPSPSCFAVFYVDQSEEKSQFEKLRSRLEEAAEHHRKSKEAQWKSSTAQAEKYDAEIIRHTCLKATMTTPKGHDGCRKCLLVRKRRKMRVETFEYPLPTSIPHRKALLFEMQIPRDFAVYRDATWKIRRFLEARKQTRDDHVASKLASSPFFKPYARKMKCDVTLASSTKPFMKTHYRKMKLPVSFNEICKPCGLNLQYFDNVSNTWTVSSREIQSIAHHIFVLAPLQKVLALPQLSNIQPVWATSSISSNDVMANQSYCPPGVNMHEFIALHETLAAKDEVRWLKFLTEFGSSNINFSTEPTRVLIDVLCSRAGRAHGSDVLRTAHAICRKSSFREKLCELIGEKLVNISENWREINCMDNLISLVLHLAMCKNEQPSPSTSDRILIRLRDTTYRWIKDIVTEMRLCNDIESNRKIRISMFQATMLFRKTFSPLAETNCQVCPDEILEAVDLARWIEVSIHLQQSIPSQPDKLPTLQRNSLMRDSKLVRRLLNALTRSLQASPESFAMAVNQIISADESHHIAAYHFVPNSWWICGVTNASQYMRQQAYSYHFVEGHFLTDGQPIGQLPAEYRNSGILKDLFGDRNILTWPSRRKGMQHMIPYSINGHEVHIGFRQNEIFVRAVHKGEILEFIPRQRFIGADGSYDLPASLVDNCYHWLNIHRGELDIRLAKDIWKSKAGGWKIDVNTRTAYRYASTVSTLVDRFSPTFRKVSSIFQYFEHEYNLQVSLSRSNTRPPRLRVELARLDLAFFVNANGLLESSQLHAEVDPNQDAGTWYGLRSMLVLRNTSNPLRRMIITPLGQVSMRRQEFHVAVYVQNEGIYGRFALNEVLGRVECPMEPLLVYSKAVFHAATSFVLPDPLTGRTGTEEARHLLQSGLSLPWIPLGQGPMNILSTIAKFAPIRVYYPRGLKFMEKVTWDSNLTATIQHDAYLPLVHAILARNQLLQNFTPSLISAFEPPTNETHLATRASYRRSRVERRWQSCKGLKLTDSPYLSRHMHKSSSATRNVSEIVSLLVTQPSTIHVPGKLVKHMKQWRDVGGFSVPYEHSSLTKILNLQLDKEWGSLVRSCIKAGQDLNFFEVSLTIGLLAFRNDVTLDLVRILVAFAIYPEFKSIRFPDASVFVDYAHLRKPAKKALCQLIRECAVPYSFDDDLEVNEHDSIERHSNMVSSECNTIVNQLLIQWPCDELALQPPLTSSLIIVANVMKNINAEWHRLYQNWQLSKAIDTVQTSLQRRVANERMALPEALHRHKSAYFPIAGEWLPSLPDLLSKSETNLGKVGGEVFDHKQHLIQSMGNKSENIAVRKSNLPQINMQLSNLWELGELKRILRSFSESESHTRRAYAKDLAYSAQILQDNPKGEEIRISSSYDKPSALHQLEDARKRLSELQKRITQSLDRGNRHLHWLRIGGLWPVTSSVSLLEELRSISAYTYSQAIRNTLVDFGVRMTEIQRLARIYDSYCQKDMRRLDENIRNEGHENWDPRMYPDWLLFEIEANVLLRPKQIDVTKATVWPSSKQNSVLQMNMGEGKTSCIIPICAITLADTRRLARVVVPKALLQQTAQLLQGRLGGLLGRSLTHVPWSRKTSTSSTSIEAYSQLLSDTKNKAGVLILLPEHLLSFDLSGKQRLSDGKALEAKSMIDLQTLSQMQCRDILDESDHTLAVRTQLIYPSGTQVAVDGHPHRWEVAEHLLKLTVTHLSDLSRRFPRSIQVQRLGGFWTLHFLRPDVEDALLELLVEDILQDRVPLLITTSCEERCRAAIQDYVSLPVIKDDVTSYVQDAYGPDSVAMQLLHLCRGLLANRILFLTLRKKWNVEYGLHPDRDPLAVPYHAKGIPSDEAEWGHPDVAILSTCLSFYYGGLRLHELRQTLENVAKSDDPAGEFERWQEHSVNLPDSLRDWNSISIEDELQVSTLWTHVKCEMAVIDYFLNRFVFPKFAKQFTVKLQASGWNIPIFTDQPVEATTSSNSIQNSLTTGFSGTNDNRSMLPLTISQQDLASLAHTNAEVLTYLLQTRNRETIIAASNQTSPLSERGMLEVLFDRRIRVLIDAGAMILEMDNATVARVWLEVDWSAPAAIYFGENDKPMVLSRKQQDKPLPLVATPYAEDLGDALVYLDQSHTRGTDLKFSSNAVGALTLGLGQTKDATVQAAMRLRQLSSTQSIVFLIPPQVQQSILDLCKLPLKSKITSVNVVYWLLEQTCVGLEQLQPLYYAQGLDFCQRHQAAIDFPQLLSSTEHRSSYLSSIQHREYVTLETMYKPKARDSAQVVADDFAPELQPMVIKLEKIHQNFQLSGFIGQASALEEVEQEREVAFEVETVRQVQRPLQFSALQFRGLHRDISAFLQSGCVRVNSDAYEAMLVALAGTRLGSIKGVRTQTVPGALHVSKEHTRTIALKKKPNDDFIRHVNYVLYNMITDSAIVISPEEAAAAKPILENLEDPSTHLLLYSAPTTRKMARFYDLAFYSLPALPADWRAPQWLRLHLGLFAGVLYFDYEDYAALNQLLGIKPSLNPTNMRSSRKEVVPRNTLFTNKPMQFMQEWLSVRRKGQDFTHTPMGQVCQGRILTADDPFFKISSAKKRMQYLENGGEAAGGIVGV